MASRAWAPAWSVPASTLTRGARRPDQSRAVEHRVEALPPFGEPSGKVL